MNRDPLSFGFYQPPIVLVGGTGSGKTTLAKALEAKGFKRIVTYTTRPKRAGEKNGVDYHFLTAEQFKQKFIKDFFAEITTYNADFGFCMYGSAKQDYKTTDKSVIVLNPKGVLELEEFAFVVYLDICENILKERALKRGDTIVEITRRLKDDKPYFDEMVAKKNPDLHIKYSTSVDKMVNRIIKAYESSRK